ncbi:MAG: 2-C-methyl-D-erythritol 2,4-cyclodiphosphate synthase [Fervidobacterium sp.]
MKLSKINFSNIDRVVELIYNEKREFFDELFGKNASDFIKEALLEDIPPFIKNNSIILEDGQSITGVLLYANKADFRHGYQKWFRILGLKIFPVGSKMIYIIERILMDFSVNDRYIISLAGNMREYLLYRFLKENRYKKVIVDTFEKEIFEKYGFTEERPAHQKMIRFSKFCDYQTFVGLGWDTHPLVKDRKLILGGVDINSEYGLDGHSDADVLCHSLIDSIVGITHKKDIGIVFPENEENKGRRSLEMLSKIVKTINTIGFFPSSVDCVIISPVKLKDFREKIITNLEEVLNCPVSIKFKSGNGVYPESEMKGITSICVSNIDKI